MSRTSTNRCSPVPIQTDHLAWQEWVRARLPATYEIKAHELKAFVRVRAIAAVDDLLRSLLCWALASGRHCAAGSMTQHIKQLFSVS